MFDKIVDGYDIVEDAGDQLIPNITGSDFSGDYTMLAVARVLFRERLNNGSSLVICNRNLTYSMDDLEGVGDRTIVGVSTHRYIKEGRPGTVYVANIRRTDEAADKLMEILERGFLDRCPGFKRLPDVEKFLEQAGKIKALVFISEALNSCAIYVKHMDIPKYHLVCSLMSRYLPGFIAKKPLNEEETSLLRSLTLKTPVEFDELITKLTNKIDFRSEKIKTLLGGFESKLTKKKLENVSSKISRNRSDAEDLEERFEALYREMELLKVEEAGLIAIINDPALKANDELKEFFMQNKNLVLERVSDMEIHFIVKTICTSYNPDCIENAIDNHNSFVYKHWRYGTRYSEKNTLMTDERIKKLMTAIFVDEKMFLKLCAAYTIDFGYGRFHGCKDYEYPASILREYTPNQHIQVYGCLGGNEPQIRKAVREHDFVSAVICCEASAANINFTEANTGTFFMERITAPDAGKIIQLEDGTSVTPIEAVEYLEKQEEAKNE